MPIDFSLLEGKHDLLFEIPLKVRQGNRFQPTGFPDLGAAEFETSAGRSLLVESAQSMANRLEAVCWDESRNDLISSLRGLSYVRVEREQKYLTSTITDSHRLNSPYILESKDKTFFSALQTELGALETGPINRRVLAQTLMKYDVASLIHGLFLAKKELAGGRLRVARALTAFVEAHGVGIAASGGAKHDHVDPSGTAYGQGGANKGFGHVPFPRDEYTADSIVLYISVDLAQIRGYGLDESATKMLILLALFKVRLFLDSPMRLRSACCFDLCDKGDVVSRNVSGFCLPPSDAFVGAENQDGTYSGELPTLIRRLTLNESADSESEGDSQMRVKTVQFTS